LFEGRRGKEEGAANQPAAEYHASNQTLRLLLQMTWATFHPNKIRYPSARTAGLITAACQPPPAFLSFLRRDIIRLKRYRLPSSSNNLRRRRKRHRNRH